MDSDKSDEDEHEAVSKQIVEYYKKYSQTKQLPKYFSGTSLSYMPPIVKGDVIDKPEIIIYDTSTTTLIEALPDEDFPKTVSPTSSVASNRKLEWDNGADIGYGNCTKLRKSLSLPTVIVPAETKGDKKPSKKQMSSHVVTVVSYDGSSRGLPVQFSSSSSSAIEQPVEMSSSSSGKSLEKAFDSSTSSEPKPNLISSSVSLTSSTSYLKRKIGSPDARSTPKVTQMEKTKASHETPFLSTTHKKGIVSLVKTKPISVECLHDKVKIGTDKEIQTSMNEGLSKSVQTGNSLEVIQDKPLANNQSVIIIDYASTSDRKSSSCDTQANSIASSFEYYDKKVEAPSKNVALNSSDDTPVLAKLIVEKQSTSLITDVDKSLEILQKLVKSKKYDNATKKYYIKKIVEKIMDNKYEDSSTSSDLFIPQKQQKLQENIPWQPPQLSKFTVKTFNNEFLPVQEQNVDVEPLSQDSSSLEKQNFSSGSYQSWKENKTLSERKFESKHNGQGDHILNFAKKERQHQISWIKDEISHLTNIKRLLEKPRIQKTTTVYMVSQQLNQASDSSRGSSGNPSRNYVIETELSGTSSSETKDFNYIDKSGVKSYQVRELRNRITKNAGRFVGDIKVVSDDNTTNIKVTARTLSGSEKNVVFQAKPPSLIGPGKYDTYPKSRAEEQKCWPCGMIKQQRTGSLQTQPYSIDVPLETDATSLSRRVNALISKYGSKSSSSNICKRDCNYPCSKLSQSSNTKNVEIGHHSNIDSTTNEKICDNLKKIGSSEVTSQKHCPCLSKFKKAREHESYPKPNVKNTCCQCNKLVNLKSSKPSCQNSSCQSDEPPKTEMKNSYCQGCPSSNKLQSSKPTVRNSSCQCEKVQEDKTAQKTEYENKCCQSDELSKNLVSSKTTTQDICCQCDLPKKLKQSSTRSGEGSIESLSSGTETSDIVETTTESWDSTIRSCVCCKRKDVQTRFKTKNLHNLKKQLSDQAYPFCRPCYRQCRRTTFSPNIYKNPGHVCSCYTVVQTKTLNAIKKTISDLNNLDQQYCSCVEKSDRNSSICQYCRCKLRKTSKNSNGIAYMLTFENDELHERTKKPKKREHLEEIKIKIPVFHKKRHKEKENKRERERITSENGETSTTDDRQQNGRTLKEYLAENRPDFVEVAEERRKAVTGNRAQREETSTQNRLAFLQKYCQDTCERNSKRLFSSKEMKDITRRNYQKLPEVRQKLVNNQQRQIKQANRLMADTFNRKLRENVLNGKRSLPTDINVINM